MAKCSSVPRTSIWGQSRVSGSASFEKDRSYLPIMPVRRIGLYVYQESRNSTEGFDSAARSSSCTESVWRALHGIPRRRGLGVPTAPAMLHMTTKGSLCRHGDNDRAASMQRRAIRPLRIGASIQGRYPTGLRTHGKVVVLPASGPATPAVGDRVSRPEAAGDETLPGVSNPAVC